MHNPSAAQVAPYKTGFLCRCPRCGEGKLIEGLLSVKKSCSVCGLDYSFADAADGPAVFVMFIVGFLFTGLALMFEFTFNPPLWLHIVIWPPVLTIASIALLRPLKGIMIVLQYGHDAKEGEIDDKEDD